jgi:hypothetical protein
LPKYANRHTKQFYNDNKIKRNRARKKVNEAQRNVRLSEAKVQLHRQKIEEIEQKDVTEVHTAAALRTTKIELNHAEKDLQEARETLINAEADPDVIDKAIERMLI